MPLLSPSTVLSITDEREWLVSLACKVHRLFTSANDMTLEKVFNGTKRDSLLSSALRVQFNYYYTNAMSYKFIH